MRRLLRDIAEGRTLGDLTTLRDPTVMAVLERKVAAAKPKRNRRDRRREHSSYITGQVWDVNGGMDMR